MSTTEARRIAHATAARLDGFPATDLQPVYAAWTALFGSSPMPSYVDEETGRPALDLAAAVARMIQN